MEGVGPFSNHGPCPATKSQSAFLVCGSMWAQGETLSIESRREAGGDQELCSLPLSPIQKLQLAVPRCSQCCRWVPMLVTTSQSQAGPR